MSVFTCFSDVNFKQTDNVSIHLSGSFFFQSCNKTVSEQC